ncbi:MAG: hypothetical protein ACYDHZ_10855 [Dehalococcoidia bacterium]
MIQIKLTQIIDKDNRLLLLFGGMLLDILLLIALVIYAGMQLAS